MLIFLKFSMSQAFMYSAAKHSFVFNDTSKGNGNIVYLCSLYRKYKN